MQFCSELGLPARQYGEVVLPDASTGQGPGALARKLSRCKEGMVHFLQSWYKFYCLLARSRYKFDKWTSISHGRRSPEKALAQCRGRICLRGRNLSWYRKFVACSCACPGATAIANLSWVQEHKQKV